MSKRKQRSTAIRKRIEKKQREQQKADRKAQKAAAGSGDDEDRLVAFTLPRERVEACRAQLVALEERLAQGSLRGWTTSDLEGEHGLAWLARVLGEALEASDGDPVSVELFDGARQALLERMGALELAASGLKLEWDEAGFDELLRALNQAEEPSPPDEDAVPEVDPDAGADAADDDEAASSSDEPFEDDATV